MDDQQTLVSTEWLAAHIDDDNLCILDGSWYLPAMERDAAAEFAKSHIPNAQRFDIDQNSDSTSPLPHMAPRPEDFAASTGKLGISNDSQVVVYDGKGLFSAARVWWLFKLMGHKNVAVLDGGLPKWCAEGRPVTDATPTATPATYTAQQQAQLVRDQAQVLAATTDDSITLLDARPAERFAGNSPEPRAGMRAGHMPSARNLPFPALLTSDGTMKTGDALRAAFIDAGVDFERKIITTCGSGVTASILALGLSRLGHTDWALYDGSWSEWGASADLPIATGDA